MDRLPTSVRYIKVGQGGSWWDAARRDERIYAGWAYIPQDLIASPDRNEIRAYIDRDFAGKPTGAATNDFNALMTLLDRPSQHIWVTIQGQHLWWCTVNDQAEGEPISTKNVGHFWLKCSSPWSNWSLDNKRELLLAKLPGSIGISAGFRATVCKPSKHEAIRRIIANELDPEARKAEDARQAYQSQLSTMLDRLHWKDFELLIDLILARGGWARIERRGVNKAVVDIEAENIVTGEMLVAQVKSQAHQNDVDDFASKIWDGQDRKLIFACHQPQNELTPPKDSIGQVIIWNASEVARRAVAAGLGEWIEERF